MLLVVFHRVKPAMASEARPSESPRVGSDFSAGQDLAASGQIEVSEVFFCVLFWVEVCFFLDFLYRIFEFLNRGDWTMVV